MIFPLTPRAGGLDVGHHFRGLDQIAHEPLMDFLS